MTEVAVIPASYVKLSTMVDGTIRVVIDVEPTNRDAAFALFDRPGAPLAIARLSNGAAVEHDRKAQTPPAEPLERKPLSLASKIALRCGERSFQDYCRQTFGEWDGPACQGQIAENRAAHIVREICHVNSRSEITPGSRAEKLWGDLEADYHHWQRTGRAA